MKRTLYAASVAVDAFKFGLKLWLKRAFYSSGCMWVTSVSRGQVPGIHNAEHSQVAGNSKCAWSSLGTAAAVGSYCPLVTCPSVHPRWCSCTEVENLCWTNIPFHIIVNSGSPPQTRRKDRSHINFNGFMNSGSAEGNVSFYMSFYDLAGQF